MPETAEAVKQTTQEKILEKELTEREDDLDAVANVVVELGERIKARLSAILSSKTPTLPELKQLALDMSSLALGLEGASGELTAVAKLAAATAPYLPACKGIIDDGDAGAYTCLDVAKYFAPKKDESGTVIWVPICERHAKTWWDGADVVGKMVTIGGFVVTP